MGTVIQFLFIYEYAIFGTYILNRSQYLMCSLHLLDIQFRMNIRHSTFLQTYITITGTPDFI